MRQMGHRNSVRQRDGCQDAPDTLGVQRNKIHRQNFVTDLMIMDHITVAGSLAANWSRNPKESFIKMMEYANRKGAPCTW